MMSSSGKLRQSPKKGPGKVKENVKTSSKPRSSEIAGDVPSKELSYPYIKVADNEHLFPRYFTVLNRSEEDGIGMEDMDALQLEMEAMLSTIVKRNYILNDEIQVMNTAEEKRDKKNKANMGKGGPPSPGKRSKHHEKPVKKLKDVSKPKDTNTHSPLSIKINKNKVTPGQNVTSSPAQTAPMSDPHELPDQTKMGSRRVLVPKNDTPNKFWLSVEPYCADILPEDIKLLDMMIQEHDQGGVWNTQRNFLKEEIKKEGGGGRNLDTDYQKIPPLGRHYSLRWAQEDMLEEQDAASSQGKMGKGKPVELPHLSRRVDRPSETVGPLTQRLITSFMEENVMVPVIEPPAFDRTKVRGGENATPPRLNTFRLEKRQPMKMREEALAN
ncbi:unnamed protein product [Timema podura]|uniref:Uncharacterized protein n=1 Tax=Timema podura TaxID=61482 RepID=A0ABN7NR72_TIMPD|nr:unnamed protein product [Timema podura]